MPDFAPADVAPIFAEMDALHSALCLVDSGVGDRFEVEAQLQTVLEQLDPTADTQSYVKCVALSSMLQRKLTLKPPTEKSPAEAVGLLWAANLDAPLRKEEASKLNHTLNQSEEAMFTMALKLWVEALQEGKTPQGKRLWKRSLDVSASFGTNSHSMLQWAYAATWWPKKS